jgi:hypothetical protein
MAVLDPVRPTIEVDRIIRTDFYVRERSGLVQEAPVGDLSVVWLSGENGGYNTNMSQIMFFPIVPAKPPPYGTPFDPSRDPPPPVVFSVAPAPSEIPTAVLIDAVLRFGEDRNAVVEFLRQHPTHPSPLAEYLLLEPIIVERSPPAAEGLGSLLHGATSISTGFLLGSQLTHEPLFLLITVPAGVILMGAAIGIATGLQKGLAGAIMNALLPPTRPHTSKSRTRQRPRPKAD